MERPCSCACHQARRRAGVWRMVAAIARRIPALLALLDWLGELFEMEEGPTTLVIGSSSVYGVSLL